MGSQAQGTLAVLTLNLGHGRGERFTHRWVRRAEHVRTLARVSSMVTRTAAQVVALQELDAPSVWSGRLDHLQHLEQGTGAVGHGSVHTRSPVSASGTGLLAHPPLSRPLSYTFAARGPTPRKGFTLATVSLDRRPLVVVSVHLDFVTTWVKQRQLAELCGVLKSCALPCVVAGDFNLGPDAAAMDALVGPLSLRTSPLDRPTFWRTGGFLDRVYVSPELHLEHHEVLPDRVSDHQPVLGRVRWRG